MMMKVILAATFSATAFADSGYCRYSCIPHSDVNGPTTYFPSTAQCASLETLCTNDGGKEKVFTCTPGTSTVTGTFECSSTTQCLANASPGSLCNIAGVDAIVDPPGTSGLCYTTGSSCITDSSSSDCFHESTVVSYKGNAYTMHDFQLGKEPECAVPHTPTAKGLIVKTSCELDDLRVTDGHLLGTPAGFVAAISLEVGDAIYRENRESLCEVVSIEREAAEQIYFGLNCLHSEVSANGLHTSTFGDLHEIPALYMKVVGTVFGIELASSSGLWLQETFY